MKSLKSQFVKSNILMLLISAALVLLVTALLAVILSSNNWHWVRQIAEVIHMLTELDRSPQGGLIYYLIIWTILVIFVVVVTCAALTMRLARIILRPLNDLTLAAQNIKDGKLDFEVFSCKEQEINDLCLAFDDVRKKLKKNALQEIESEAERNMLVANISHDMRTPITTIKGYMEGLMDGIADTPEKRDRYMQTIYNKTIVLEQLVDSMTEYAELQLGRMKYNFEFIDLTTYLKELMSDYIIEIEEKDMVLELLLKDEPAPVMADPIKLKRVIDNVLSNAVKYNREKGRIAVKTEVDEKGVFLTISDTGKGIQNKDVKKVFEGFFRADLSRNSSIKGHGLGLTISKQIIENHHGKIWIKSEENIGTEVFIYLPKRPAPEN